MKGVIAIDIDGTLTAVRDALSVSVVEFLHSLVQEEWKLLFVTGRTVTWSLHLLHKLPFPYVLSAFNGAHTMLMPEGRLIDTSYLHTASLSPLMPIISTADVAAVIYPPPDTHTHSLFVKAHASTFLIHHLEKRFEALHESWELSDSFLTFEQCVAVRLFCLPEVAKTMSLDCEEALYVHAPVMKDSYDSRFSIVQITDAKASKGHALDTVCDFFGHEGVVIACGDDHNDISMLEKADIRVVMATAPAEVLAYADCIARPASEDGLIDGLQRVLAK